MATLVLSAAGAAIGGAVGGSVLGLSSAVIGRAIGATIGSAIDQRLLGSGSAPVHTGRVETFRVQGASEGAAVPRVFGRMRVGGNVVWASKFRETKSTSRTGSKGNTRTVISYAYSVSLAVALCEGVVTRIGRVWADGNEISLDGMNWRLHPGDDAQMPDPLIEAIEGAQDAPAYRGVAYLVFEDLDLTPFGNRVPQFNIEVIRKVAEQGSDPAPDPYAALRSVALIPGSGEYALATSPVLFEEDKGVSRWANINNADGRADIVVSLDHLSQELPAVESVSLVVSWFGDDLRCGQCQVRPKVEFSGDDPAAMPWRVSDETRNSAGVVSQLEGRAAFGGTPTDASVLEAIAEIKAGGRQVMFYPFVLMDIPDINGRTDPWTGGAHQPVYPWRGRITASVAPGLAGTTDKTAAVEAEIDTFFGSAVAGDFTRAGGVISYTGPAEWSFRRFILHYAHLCAEAGGVETFIIGSEMRSLTTLRDDLQRFPAVTHLVNLAAEVRSILGAGTKISYAADWTEYFGYHPTDGSNDVFFHLDDLWAAPDIDFVGIDNYMPLADWRDEADHVDAAVAESTHDLTYLRGNIAGGEGFDWYYLNAADRDAQVRLPISDGTYGEPWVFRYKDLVSWWSQPHHNRPGGFRDGALTAWVPQSKPIWFTEFGCPAIDKGANQPNVFFDPKSSESQAPYYSNRNRDDFIQYRYLQAHAAHWADATLNPVSTVYGAPMVDFARAHVWAWDARPWPDFPNRVDVWSDGENYGTGHWVSGRTGMSPLAAIVSEVAERANFADYDVSTLQGAVHGYLIASPESARQSLQPLMLSHGFDGFERGDTVVFRNRLGVQDHVVEDADLVRTADADLVSMTRAAAAETSSQVQVSFYRSDGDYLAGVAAAGIEDDPEPTLTKADVPVALSAADGVQVASRWLSEARVARDTASFRLPPSHLNVTAGDVVSLTGAGGGGQYRIDRIEEAGARTCEATRVEPGVYLQGNRLQDRLSLPTFSHPLPVYVEFLDLPLITGSELAHAPLIAATAAPWPGPVAVYSATSDNAYALNTQVTVAATVGTLETALPRQAPWVWAWGSAVRVRLASGELVSATEADVLDGANLAAIRAPGAADWEVIQFQSATLVGGRTYDLNGLLRGQFGTEAFIPDAHAVGTDFVLLDNSAAQVQLSLAERGLERHYRVGPATRGYDDPVYSHVVQAFDGVGLRPYPPAQVRAATDASGDLTVHWVRQTRLGGDSWIGADVALGEDDESYILRVVKDAVVVREVAVTAPTHTYTAADQTADAIAAPYDIDVAQLSAQFGPGPFTRITING